jgi:2-hydroxychromene-2-carboxylate isomerase
MTENGQLRVDAFVDLRSPYSYLAIQPARALAKKHGATFDWWPFITDFQSAYGGEVAQRSTRDVAKLKYLYMDCRRLATLQGLTIRATTKLWDATLGSQAMLFTKSKGRLWEFCDPLLAAFWRREFDLESATAVEAALVNAGLNAGDWHAYQQAAAQSELAAALQHAERLGVFGAPTFVHGGELFWGGDRLPLLDARLAAGNQPASPAP